MKIHFHKNFDKQHKRLSLEQRKRVKERLFLFLENPFHPILGNHPLKGKYVGYRSINITGNSGRATSRLFFILRLSYVVLSLRRIVV